MKPAIVFASLRRVCLALGVPILFAATCKKNGSPGQQTADTVYISHAFSVSGAKLLDSTGNAFVARGINVNGPLWPWTRETVPDIPLIADVWKCNMVRINCWPTNPPYNNTANSDLNAIVTGFTSRHIVAMIEDHSFTGTFPDDSQLTASIAWWTNLANRYKGNGYVWFNLMNEPGNTADAPDRWLQVHKQIIQAIRATGSKNVVVCDENGFGQANGFRSVSNSAALSFGPQLTSAYDNVAFSLHLYDEWNYGAARLHAYLEAAKAANIAVLLGEYGTGPYKGANIAADMFNTAIPEQIGRLAWHWDGTDVFKLTTTGGGWSIDNSSGAKPGNLSFSGNLVWDDNHGTLVPGAAELTPPPVIMADPDFEATDESPVNGSATISGWINFGTASMTNQPGEVEQGNWAVKIAAGSAGGFGQSIYLQPGASFEFSAWGKHSATAAAATTIGINYAHADGSETTIASLNFTEAEWTQKKSAFTMPADLDGLRVFVYKNDAGPAFFIDDIRITKQ